MKKLCVLLFLIIVSQGLKAGSGDVNGDGLLTSADVEILTSYIMTGTPEDIKLEVANVNDDNNIDVADIVLLLNKIINGQYP